jgi:hypothetical protein
VSGGEAESRQPPKVFLSYAHDDAAHEDAVRRFYEFLRLECGIDAVFDRVGAQSPQEWTVWMLRELAETDFVLCVVSPDYKAAADAQLPADVRRGAQWEARQLREEFYRDADSARLRILTCSWRAGRLTTFPYGWGQRAARTIR